MKKIYKIDGMHCASCAKLIETELEDKVNSIKVDLDKNTATMDFNEKKIAEKDIISIITKMGYKIKQ